MKRLHRREWRTGRVPAWLASAALGCLFAAGLATQLTAADAPATRPAADAGAVDWDRARALLQRERRGDKLSPDEQAYLDHAKAVRQAGGQPDRPGPATRPGEAGGDVDMARARELFQRSQRGEKLTPEEQAYLDRALAQRRAAPPNAPAGGPPGH